LVLTKDAEVAEKAKAAGHEAGEDELLEKLIGGEVPLDTFQRALCTKDILSDVQKKAARLLGPRGLMPNPKTNTVFDEGSVLLEKLEEQSNTITFRTESSGIMHFPIGKGSFESKKLLDNLQTICQTVQDLKPENYGKGKKKKKGIEERKKGGGRKAGRGARKETPYALAACTLHAAQEGLLF